MARRRGATAVAVVEPQQEEEEEEQETSGTGLKFNESLSWRAGNKPSTGELLRRLKLFADELQELEQGEEDRDALTRPAKELVHPNLLQHKDKGVRAYATCCLADIFRLCAPEAPFSAQQIKEIFSVIISSIIPALSDAADPYHVQHLYVLSSLAQVKSIVLLADVPSPNQLIFKLFETCFDILSSPGEEMSKNIEYHMTSIVESMVDESQTLPPEVIEIVLAQFLRADPKLAHASSSRAKKGVQTAQDDFDFVPLAQYSAAYNMAKNVANTCVDKMSRYVSQYFSNCIVTATSSSADRSRKTKGRNSRRESSPVDDDDLDGDEGPDAEGLVQLDKAHKLLRELWRAAPGVLQNVIPQIETELNAENVDIRIIATETIGDMASGIGAAGPPPPAILDPAVYPSFTLSSVARQSGTLTGPSLPSAPQAFSQTHPTTYQGFLGRQNDKSPLIRAALVTSIGRILSTSAGGIGLESQEETDLITILAAKLADIDERVRIAVIESIASLHFLDIVNIIGSSGGIDKPGTVLHNLALLVKDRRPSVRAHATQLLGRLWGVASGEITLENARISELFGAIPSAIFGAIYVNEIDVNVNIDRALYESLMPMGWPNVKKKIKGAPQSQDAAVDSQNQMEPTNLEAQADKLRVERLLTMLKGLDDKAKKVFFSLMKAQKNTTEYFKAYLKRCEDYKGGAVVENAKEVKTHLGKLIEFYSKSFIDPPRAAEDLWKFAKAADKRNIVLLRFAVADDSDYGKVYKSLKELQRRTESVSTVTGTLPQTLTTLSYKVANILYNRSHIHPIMEFSRSADDSLAEPAHELTKEISSVRPGVFKAHIQELCAVLQDQAPRPGRPNDADALDSLKACAAFAKRFPKEVSKDPKFIQAMTQFALRGTPAVTAKYATSIIMSVPDKKELRMNDLLKQCTTGFTYGSEHFMARLATLSQLMLLAATSLDEVADVDPVIDVAIEQVLSLNRTAPSAEDPDWNPQPDEECEAKTWALKLLVNRLRSYDSAEKAKEAATPVYKLLNKLVVNEGELTSSSATPRPHRSWLHIQAALQLLKLSTTHNFDEYLLPKNFNHLATVAQASILPVRQAFVNKVQKYLGQDRMPSRFYTVIFLLAFEPTRKLRQDASTWLKARAQLFAKAKKTTFETTFSRLLSLLAHHPDFENSPEELKLSADYILFYLKAVATEANIPLIYHIAQKLRSVTDAIDPNKSENLYILSELALTIIGHFVDFHGWSMQTYPGKIGYPSGLFRALPSSEMSLQISQKQYLPQELVDELEGHVKNSMRQSKKRRSGDAENGDGPNKKQRANGASSTTTNATSRTKATPRKTGTKTPKKKKPAKAREESPPLTERRKSGRGAAVAKKSYAEVSDAEDDIEMEQWEDGAEEEEEDSAEEVEAGNADDVEEVPAPQKRITVKRTPVSKKKIPVPEVSDDELSEPPASDDE